MHRGAVAVAVTGLRPNHRLPARRGSFAGRRWCPVSEPADQDERRGVEHALAGGSVTERRPQQRRSLPARRQDRRTASCGGGPSSQPPMGFGVHTDAARQPARRRGSPLLRSVRAQLDRAHGRHDFAAHELLPIPSDQRITGETRAACPAPSVGAARPAESPSLQVPFGRPLASASAPSLSSEDCSLSAVVARALRKRFWSVNFDQS